MIHDKMFADILKKYDSLDGQEYTAKKGKTSLNEASNMHDVLGRLNLLESGYPADTNQLKGEDEVETPKGPVGKLVGEAEEEMADNDHDFFAKMNERFAKPSFYATAQETFVEKILDAISKCTDPAKKNKLVDLATRAGVKNDEINRALHPTTESESVDSDEEQLDEYRFHYGMTKQQMTPDYAKALAKRHFNRKLRDEEFKKNYGTDAYDNEYERLKRDEFYGKPEQRESIDEFDEKFNEAFGEEETVDPFDAKYEQEFSQEDEIEEGTHDMINSLATLASDEWENTKKRYNDEFMQDTPPKSQPEEGNQDWFKSVLDRLFGNDERVNAR